MPQFIWILRDFSLGLEDENNNPITSNEYLENALSDVSIGKHSEITNTVRQKLKDFFTVRQCFTMVRPCEEEEDLQ